MLLEIAIYYFYSRFGFVNLSFTSQLIIMKKVIKLICLLISIQYSLSAQNVDLFRALELRDWNSLIQKSNNLLQKDVSNYQAYYWKQYGLVEQGKAADAIDVLLSALQHCENKKEIRSELANLYFQQGMYLQAKNELDILLKEEHPDFRIIEQRILIHEFSKERLEAINLSFRGKNLDASQAFYWIHLGDNYKNLGEYDSAIKYYKCAMDLNPLDYQTNSKLARTYLMVDPEFALQICDSVLKKDTDNIRFIQIAASAHIKLDQENEALQKYEKALVLGDSTINTIRNAGILCHKSNKQDKAIQLLTKAYDVDSTDVKIVFYLGMAETHFLNIDRGLELFDESLKLLQPDSTILSIIHKEKAGIYKDKENHQLALENYLLAHQLNPEKKFYLYLVAEQYDALNKKKEALAYYQKVFDAIEVKEGMDLLTASVRDYSESRIDQLKEDLFMDR